MCSKRLAPFKGTYKQNTGPYYSKNSSNKKPTNPPRSEKKKSFEQIDGLAPDREDCLEFHAAPETAIITSQLPPYQVGVSSGKSESSKLVNPLQPITNFSAFQNQRTSQLSGVVSPSNSTTNQSQQPTIDDLLKKSQQRRGTPSNKSRAKGSTDRSKEGSAIPKGLATANPVQTSSVMNENHSDSFKDLHGLTQSGCKQNVPQSNVVSSQQQIQISSNQHQSFIHNQKQADSNLQQSNVNESKDEYYKEIIGDLMKKLENMNKENTRLQQISENLSQGGSFFLKKK